MLSDRQWEAQRIQVELWRKWWTVWLPFRCKESCVWSFLVCRQRRCLSPDRCVDIRVVATASSVQTLPDAIDAAPTTSSLFHQLSASQWRHKKTGFSGQYSFRRVLFSGVSVTTISCPSSTMDRRQYQRLERSAVPSPPRDAIVWLSSITLSLQSI